MPTVAESRMIWHARRMPKLNRDRFRALRMEADWSTAELAEMLEMAEGSLRNAEAAREPMGERKIYRAARFFTAQLGRQVTYQELVSHESGDGVPDTPPQQPPSPGKPEPQRDEKAGRGPKRGVARVGAL